MIVIPKNILYTYKLRQAATPNTPAITKKTIASSIATTLMYNELNVIDPIITLTN